MSCCNTLKKYGILLCGTIACGGYGIVVRGLSSVIHIISVDHPKYDRAVIPNACAVQSGGYFVVSFILSQIMMRKLPAAVWVFIGMIFYAAGVGLSVWTLGDKNSVDMNIFFSFGVLPGIGTALFYVNFYQTTISWFPEKKGMAVGVMGAGSAAGPLAWNLISQTFAEQVGAVWTIIDCGIVVFCCLAFGLFCPWRPGSRPPADAGCKEMMTKMIPREARCWRFVALWFFNMINMVGGIGIQSVLLDWLRKGPLNMSEINAGYYSTVFTSCVLVFRVVSGVVYDRLKAYSYMYLLNACQVAIWCILLIQQKMPEWQSDGTSTIVLVALCCVFFGFGATSWAPLAIDVIGGSTSGLMVTAVSAAQMCGQVIMGTFFGKFGEIGMFMPFAALMFGLHVATTFLVVYMGKTRPTPCQEEALMQA